MNLKDIGHNLGKAFSRTSGIRTFLGNAAKQVFGGNISYFRDDTVYRTKFGCDATEGQIKSARIGDGRPYDDGADKKELHI